MSGKVRKAVLPVAGLGTRVLPAAKVTPKEMLNVVDRPILSYIIEEGRAAGIEHFVFVTGRGKGAIEDYFDHHVELEAQLEAKGKLDILADVRRDLPKPGEMSFVRQMAPLGLGHAVWCARDIIGDEPFAVMLPDSPMMAEPGALAQAIAAFEQVGGNIVVVEPAPEGQAHKYGIVALEGQKGRLNRMTGMVEKPAPGTEPSNLFISGRYVLQPEIFDRLAKHQKGAG
ncbi:MAG: UTP--glucose-1-phosphate uridylyltransferase, partial [Phenylobacterium sp.]|nr:UTP--glucose-1-phosphate uridylyltransferase [Phenylobacterium sp.]